MMWILSMHGTVVVAIKLVSNFSKLIVELGGTQNFKTVQYFIKYHSINNYRSI